MDVCQVVFGKPHHQLTPDEYRRFRQLTRKVNYYRHYQRNKQTLREAKQDKKRQVLDALGWPAICQQCEYARYIGALDFHHFDPETKVKNVLELPLIQAIEEARKCQLICANCHREQHHYDPVLQTMGRPRTPDPLLDVYMRAVGLSEDVIQAAMTGR